jgi:CO dehydrogenase/acetyl-CoA synthase alpha subunit
MSTYDSELHPAVDLGVIEDNAALMKKYQEVARLTAQFAKRLQERQDFYKHLNAMKKNELVEYARKFSYVEESLRRCRRNTIIVELLDDRYSTDELVAQLENHGVDTSELLRLL